MEGRSATDAHAALVVSGRFERLARYWPLLILLVAATLYLPVLGARPFRFEEGRRFAQALAILHGGSWWRLETFGLAYVNKPPMLPWLIVLSAKLLGAADEVAARLPGLVAVTGGALTAGWLAGRMATARRSVAALFAAVFYAASHTVFMRAMLSETDAAASFFAACSFLIWVLARLKGPIGPAAWIGITLCFAATLLTKGPVPLLFPLLPMILIPMRERRPGELAKLGLCLGVSLLPLGFWLDLNADAATVTRISSELRLREAGLWSWPDYLRHLPESIGAGIVTSMPAAAAGIAWIWLNRSWGKLTARWLDHALFLYAIPVSILVLLWPQSAGRYIMPAAWPLAVMSGLWGARFWSRRAVRALLGAVFAAFIAIQIAFAAKAGRTPDQIAQRKEAQALKQAFESVPDGRVLLLARNRATFNRFVYAERDMEVSEADRLACPPDAPFLLAEGSLRADVAPSAWRKITDLDEGKLTLYDRVADAPACSGPSAAAVKP